MSTLVEIEEAIVRLPEREVDQLAAWLEARRVHKGAVAVPSHEPDFLARARRIWGEQPTGETLSSLVSRGRD
jgi:hypothetical protein